MGHEDEYYSWGDVPVGLPVVDSNPKMLVWIKQENGDAVASAVGNSLVDGWVNFEHTQPTQGSYPLKSLL